MGSPTLDLALCDVLDDFTAAVDAEVMARAFPGLRVAAGVWPDGSNMVLVRTETGGGFGFGFDPTAAEQDLRVAIADGMQNGFIDALRTAVPICPGHPHPLRPQLRDVARWECPRDRNFWSCPIGSYAR